MLVDLPADRSTICILKAVENHIIALHTWFHFGDSIGLEFREVHGTPTVEAAHRPGTTVSNSFLQLSGSVHLKLAPVRIKYPAGGRLAILPSSRRQRSSRTRSG